MPPSKGVPEPPEVEIEEITGPSGELIGWDDFPEDADHFIHDAVADDSRTNQMR
jgi:hypothetical protein